MEKWIVEGVVGNWDQRKDVDIDEKKLGKRKVRKCCDAVRENIERP